MNVIEISKDNSISDLTDAVVLLLRQGYELSIQEDEFTFMVKFDFAEEEISENRLFWLDDEEVELIRNFRFDKKLRASKNEE